MTDLFLTSWEKVLLTAVEIRGQAFGFDVSTIEIMKTEALLRYRKGEGNGAQCVQLTFKGR